MGTLPGGEPPLVRVHSACLLCAFDPARCDCRRQLDRALEEVAREGRGAVVYLRGQDGRGAGLDALAAPDIGPDLRDYRVAAEILAELGVAEVRLLTNSPAKQLGLEAYGVHVVERVPLVAERSAA
jgi:3,4-dihydroxy 2-butanone 4-phosphate synthase/GTP cyclohydrolase II